MPDDQAPVPTIEIRDLTRQFGALVAVDHASFTVDRGEILGLIGPNGAGKSTLIKMLTTLLPPTSGAAVIVGHDIVREPAAVR
jgi:ABC-2 type transport system ATP-binding protein